MLTSIARNRRRPSRRLTTYAHSSACGLASWSYCSDSRAPRLSDAVMVAGLGKLSAPHFTTAHPSCCKNDRFYVYAGGLRPRQRLPTVWRAFVAPGAQREDQWSSAPS